MFAIQKHPINDDSRSEFFDIENIAELQRRMNEANKQGWFPIHEAAFKGYVNAVRRFVEHSKEPLVQLELETKDELQATPILLAALGSHLDVVQTLFELGAKIDARNINDHGLIEIASMRQDMKLIDYLIHLPDSGMNVWKRLLQAFTIDSEDVSGSVGRTLEKLTEVPEEKTDEWKMNTWKKNMNCLIENGLINTICKVLQQRNKETLISAFFLTLSLLEYVEMEGLFDLAKQLTKAGFLQLLSNFLKIDPAGQFVFDLDLICLCGKVFDRLSRTNEMLQNSFCLSNELTMSIYQNVFKLIQKTRTPVVLFSYLDYISNLLKFGKAANIQLPNIPMLVTNLIPLYRDCSSDYHLFRSLLRLTVAMSHDSIELQSQFVKEGLATYLGLALKQGSVEIKELAIGCIEIISKANVYVQKILSKDPLLPSLLLILQKSQTHQQKVLTANALWALAGDDPTQRKQMAARIRVPVLVDFLSMKSDDLYFIACDAMKVLLSQPPNTNVSIHDMFLDLHGVNTLVRVLTSDKEYIVLSVIRCMQRLCVRAGLNAYKAAQNEVKKYQGITFLVALMLHAKQEQIRAESALALAYVCLDNQTNMEVTVETLDFNYAHIYKLARSKTNSIRVLAYSALALFAYNNLAQQRAMALVGTMSFSSFEECLKSKDDTDKCETAFQLISLSNLIIDEPQANTAARGIQILVDLLKSSQTHVKVKTLVAEKIAVLGKMKSGVSDGIITIDGISALCENCYTDNENLQGTCAIALSNYSYINEGRRKLLYKCRHDPSLIDVLKFYNEYQNSKHRLSSHFNEDWQHYKNVGLPVPKDVKKHTRCSIAAESTPSNNNNKLVTFNETNGIYDKNDQRIGENSNDNQANDGNEEDNLGDELDMEIQKSEIFVEE